MPSPTPFETSRMFNASKLAGTEQALRELLDGVRAFVRDRGRHEGPHSEVTPPTFQGPTITACSMCELAYIEAETRLDECVLAAADLFAGDE